DRVESLVLERPVFHQRRGSLRETRRRVDARVARRELGPAAQARSVAARFRGRGARKEAAILALRRLDGADRAAINARRRDRDEEAAVEARVARTERAVADAGVESHAAHYARRDRACLAVFGHRSGPGSHVRIRRTLPFAREFAYD